MLEQKGFKLGQNLELLERHSDGRSERLPEFAREITGTGRIDVIVAVTEAATRAVLAANAAVPIVMVSDDPVASGLVTSAARPGATITGVAYQTAEGDAKRLQLLAEALPHARRFGYLAPLEGASRHNERMVRAAAAQLGVELSVRHVGSPEEYHSAFASMRNEGAAAAVIGASQWFAMNTSTLAVSAAANGLPTICEWDYMARAGCTFGFGHDLTYSQRRVGEYAVRILQGVSPGELPIEYPSVWELTVNRRAATTLGIAIPTSVLVQADEIIE